jgi:hypothetical protein
LIVVNKQFKIWPVLRDVIIVIVLSGLGGFIVGFASTSRHDSPLYIYSLALSNSLFCIIGFTISGCLAVENRWRHLAIVAAIVWAVSIFNVIFFEFTIIKWAASAIAIAIFAVIGGGISLLFKRKTPVEISSNAGDDKFYEEVARELETKSLRPGLWTRAVAETGDEGSAAKALYIRLRVSELVQQEQTDRANSQAEARRKAEEKKRAAEAAMPPMPWYVRAANLLFGCFCGILVVILSVGSVAMLVNMFSEAQGSDLAGDLIGGLMLLGLAYFFGWATYKSFKAF